MKFLLFAAFALSLILVVSAQQCDTNAVLTCTQDYTRMVSKLDLQLCVCVCVCVCACSCYCSNYSCILA